ncbi:hypothetical protein ACAG96_07880 [Candidatus Izemoplasma sp. B36]|uniref:hypothetical protein n=1 Tax=Candidatus Izemoplasma sp. B36 TaxID=3242468 RepID=UPI0035569C06
MKKILAAIIVALLLGGTAFAFSYWDNTEVTDSVSLTAGEGVTLSITDPSSTDTLVPAGAILKAGDTYSIELSYTVSLDQTALTALDLSVVADTVAIGGNTTLGTNYVNVSITAPATINGDAPATVTVTITLDEPLEADYAAVANGTISFNLTFTAE